MNKNNIIDKNEIWFKINTLHPVHDRAPMDGDFSHNPVLITLCFSLPLCGSGSRSLRAVLLSWLYNPKGIKGQEKKNRPTLMLPTPHSNYDIALVPFFLLRGTAACKHLSCGSVQDKSCPIIWPFFCPWWWISASPEIAAFLQS